MKGTEWRHRGRGKEAGLLFALLMMTVMTAGADDPFDDEEDDLAYSLHRLYRDSEDAVNPHDMLARPGEGRYLAPSIGKGQGRARTGDEGQQDQDQKQAASPGCEGEEEVSRELTGCLARLSSLQNSLEQEQIASLQLQKMLAKEGILDLQAFYRRAVQHLWNALKLEEGREILKEGNTALVRQVSIRVTEDDMEGLDNYLKTETQPHKVDEFLERGFTLQEPPPESSTSLLQSVVTVVTAAVHAGKSLEVWLVVLCVGFVALAAWAVVLFVRDIQRELRWGYVLGMMAVVVFFICCLWHWRHMYKMAESRRHAQLAKRGYAGIPEECQPGASSSAGTAFDWIKVNLFGSPDVCEKYFEELMIDAIEEITPGMVIAETVSRFLFQPLQHLGTESGKLTTNFYKNVPPAYHLHATALFLGLLVVVLFYGCAYGIDFPLGLGGYRPMARQDSSADGNKAGLGREAVEQLNRDRERFLEESRRMLADISRAVQGNQGQQHLVVTSSGILEAQLEQLISRRLDQAMEQGRPAGPGVRTITSTPLRSYSLDGRQMQESEVQGRGREEQNSTLGDLSSSSEDSPQAPVLLDDRGDPTALLVSTDAVHRRVAGTPAVKCLPPKTSGASSRSSSATSTPAPSELNSPAARRQKGSKIMRMFRSAETPPSPPPSPSASTKSLGQAGLDEPDLGGPLDRESFLAEVKNVLDLSANSNAPSSPESSNTES